MTRETDRSEAVAALWGVEGLRTFFREHGWTIDMDDREEQARDPFEVLAAALRPEREGLREALVIAVETIPQAVWREMAEEAAINAALAEPSVPSIDVERLARALDEGLSAMDDEWTVPELAEFVAERLGSE